MIKHNLKHHVPHDEPEGHATFHINMHLKKKMVILIIGTFTICMIWNWEITVLAFVGVILSFNGFIEFSSGFSFNSKRSWYFLNFYWKLRDGNFIPSIPTHQGFMQMHSGKDEQWWTFDWNLMIIVDLSRWIIRMFFSNINRRQT